MSETNYVEGQSVLVRTDDLLDGEAFMATVDGEEAQADSNLYVTPNSRRVTRATKVLVADENVVTLTDLFDAVMADEMNTEMRKTVSNALAGKVSAESNRNA